MPIYRRYVRPVTRARRDVRLRESRVRPGVLLLLRLLAPLYLRLGIGCAGTIVHAMEGLVEAFRAALEGEARVILAFRHPFVDEPQILGTLFLCRLAREARRLGIALRRKPHAIFVYGYEVPRWGGPLVRWLLPRTGALPVHHSRIDSAGLAGIRRAITDGDYPVALAPEGQVSYSSATVPRLEAGTMRLGLEAAEVLAATGRREQVLVLPISVHRRYRGRRAHRSLENLVRRTESLVGSRAGEVPAASLPLPRRLEILLESILEQAENLYFRTGKGTQEAPDRDGRLAAVVSAAATRAEQILGITPGYDPGQGNRIIERVYRVRRTGWDRIYTAEDPRKLSPLDRAVADRLAGEAWFAMRHMELADFAWYFRTTPPPGEAPFAITAEYVQNLYDFANRLAGGAISRRRHVRPFREVLVIGSPINLSERVPAFRTGRKAAVQQATEDLRNSFLRCAEEAREREFFS